jgi:DNA uptake protein ComE-like DNA-binding protein
MMKKGLLAAIILGLLLIGSVGILPMVAQNAQAQTEDAAITPINPNTATESELLALPGVDQGMVQTIIDHRDYADWTALSTVLSESYDADTVATLEPYWTFE